MSEHSDPRLLDADTLAAIVHNAHVATQYLLRHDALSFELGKTSLDDTTLLYDHIDAQAAEIARLRAVAEAAQRLVAGADDIDLDWRLSWDDGQGEELVYNSHLHDLATFLAALDAGGEAAGDE